MNKRQRKKLDKKHGVTRITFLSNRTVENKKAKKRTGVIKDIVNLLILLDTQIDFSSDSE